MSDHANPGQKIAHAQTEERFRLLIESVSDYGIFTLDPAGYVTSWNEGARRIKGYEADEIIGSHFSRFYPAEDIEAGKPQRELEIAVAEGRLEDEGWRLRQDGTRFWADVVITALVDPLTGELCGFGKVTRDLTERRHHEERLRQSEEQFRLLIEGVEDYAIYMLDPTGHIMTWNSGAEKAKGYTPDEIVGQSFEKFYTPEDRANGKPARLLEHARRYGQVREQGLRVRKGGATFHADVLITAVHDAKGALRGFSKVTRDITDQLKTRAMEAEKIAAEQASQAKDEFLAILSHELRTPLTPVLAASQYLLEHISEIGPEELREHLGTIRRNSLLEAQLIDDLLDLTRISRGKVELHLEGVDIHAAILDACEIVADAITGKEIRLACDLEAQPHWVWADATRIRQVVWNLMNNAVKFTPRGGRIGVRSFNHASGELIVEITDTGVGIAPDQIHRIFDAFEQGERKVTRQFGGLGLGLAITRSLVHLHRGTISAQSAGQDRGATFQVTLPSITRESAATPRSSSPPAAEVVPVRILLVDDHVDTRRILSQLLIKKGHHVEVASSVTTAVACLDVLRFDFLISDIGLPDGSGLDVMREARQRQPHIRGIALSGFGMDEDLRRSTAAGFESHLVKPVDLTSLQDFLATKAP